MSEIDLPALSVVKESMHGLKRRSPLHRRHLLSKVTGPIVPDDGPPFDVCDALIRNEVDGGGRVY